jgi:hypothetical protein
MAKITVLSSKISTLKIEEEDYICITDIAKYKDDAQANDIIKNWLRNRNTIEFLGIWEQLNNPDFKPVEFDGFRKFNCPEFPDTLLRYANFAYTWRIE